MRILRLQSPLMTGTDVADWQRFLNSQGLLQSSADGVFGPMTDQATRDFQSRAGLTADGVVGPGTVARAVAEGFVETGVQPGMDSRAGCAAFAAQLTKAGMKFVARYYSRTNDKSLSPREAQALSAAGLQIVAVYEDGANIDTFSAERGARDAAQALMLASAIGQPAGSAIYFAVDFDAAAGQVSGPITAYFRAVGQALSSAPKAYQVGVYGSGLTCRLIKEASLANYTWLAGSTAYRESGIFRPKADLLQFATSRAVLPGLNIDDDVAQRADYGSFRVPVAAPGLEADT
jgi:peptidoglycan hydrolase-like protein with peptidoglycan-binding domain